MTPIEFIKTFHKEIKEGEDELMPYLDRAVKEIDIKCYKNKENAVAYYAMHLLTKSRSCDGCDDLAPIKKENIQGVSVEYGEIEKINGITPENRYHKMFLQEIKCNIKTSIFGINEIGKGCKQDCYHDIWHKQGVTF